MTGDVESAAAGAVDDDARSVHIDVGVGIDFEVERAGCGAHVDATEGVRPDHHPIVVLDRHGGGGAAAARVDVDVSQACGAQDVVRDGDAKGVCTRGGDVDAVAVGRLEIEPSDLDVLLVAGSGRDGNHIAGGHRIGVPDPRMRTSGNECVGIDRQTNAFAPQLLAVLERYAAG